MAMMVAEGRAPATIKPELDGYINEGSFERFYAMATQELEALSGKKGKGKKGNKAKLVQSTTNLTLKTGPDGKKVFAKIRSIPASATPAENDKIEHKITANAHRPSAAELARLQVGTTGRQAGMGRGVQKTGPAAFALQTGMPSTRFTPTGNVQMAQARMGRGSGVVVRTHNGTQQVFAKVPEAAVRRPQMGVSVPVAVAPQMVAVAQQQQQQPQTDLLKTALVQQQAFGQQLKAKLDQTEQVNAMQQQMLVKVQQQLSDMHTMQQQLVAQKQKEAMRQQASAAQAVQQQPQAVALQAARQQQVCRQSICL